MYAVDETRKMIDGQEISVFSRDICNHNILTVAAGAGSFGNDKWDTKTFICIKDNGCTNWDIKMMKDNVSNGGIMMTMRGDAELDTMIEGLEFVLDALRDARAEIRMQRI